MPYSFDAGGVHVAGLDPTQPLLEPGHCGAAALEWLDRDLAAAGGPTLLFQHFPVGGEHDYVDDQAALLELIARHDVRVLVAGHVHRETVTRLDGPVQVTLQAVLKEPVFYWAEAGDGPALTVSRVTVAADGTRAGSPVATVPLTGHGRGDRASRGAAPGGPGAGPPAPDPRSRHSGGATAAAMAAAAQRVGAGRDRRGRRRHRGRVDQRGRGGGPDRGRPWDRSVSWRWRARSGPVYRRPG